MAVDSKNHAPPEAFTVFARSEHFSQKSVHDVFQDRRGFLWFATQDGVVRFDGHAWRKIGVRDGLAHPHVWKIAEHADGRLLFATAGGGVGVFDPTMRAGAGGWQRWTMKDGLASDDVRAFLVEADVIYCATTLGLSILKDGAWSTLTVADGLPSNEVLAIARSKDGAFWLGTALGAVSLTSTLQVKPVKSLPAVRTSCIVEDALSGIWLGTWGSGVHRIDEKGEMRTFTVEQGLGNNQVMCALRDRNGDVWLGTWGGGVTQVKQRAFGGRAVLSTISEGLGNNNVRSVFQDRIGRMWIGTGGAGVTCYTPPELGRGKVFRSLSTRDGLARNMVACIAQDKRKRLWFGTFAGGVSCFDAEQRVGAWRTYTAKEGLGSDTVRAALSDRDDRMWFGTTGGGVSRFDPKLQQWKTFNRASGLGSDLVRCLHETDDGRVWAGTDGGGLACFEPTGAAPRMFTVSDGLSNDHVFSIAEHGRHLYIGTMGGGLCVLDRDTLTFSQLACPSQHVMSIAFAGELLWCGTNGDGLFLQEAGRWRRWSTEEGLPHDVVYALLCEASGAVYGSTTAGVFRLTGEDIVTFDTTDGLADDECNAGAALRDSTGRLWFGTIGGASSVAPADVPQVAQPTAVYVTEMRSNGKPLPLEGEIVVSREAYELVFEYAAVEYDAPSKVRYRCQLEPLEKEWLPLTKSRSLRYTNLAPGKYTFRVAARNWSGVFSKSAELSFEVR